MSYKGHRCLSPEVSLLSLVFAGVANLSCGRWSINSANGLWVTAKLGFIDLPGEAKKEERFCYLFFLPDLSFLFPLERSSRSDTQGAALGPRGCSSAADTGRGIICSGTWQPLCCKAPPCSTVVISDFSSCKLQIFHWPVTYRVSEMSSDTSLSVECSLTWKSPSQEMLLWGRRKAQPSMCKTAFRIAAGRWRGSSSRRAVTFTCVGECRGWRRSVVIKEARGRLLSSPDLCGWDVWFSSTGIEIQVLKAFLHTLDSQENKVKINSCSPPWVQWLRLYFCCRGHRFSPWLGN